MFLENVSVKNFRSISEVKVEKCGNLNVLIGRNNSGKSTILASINAFFEFSQASEIVNLGYRALKAYDFHRNDNSTPIQIVLQFVLTLAERDEIVQWIMTELPQMKNAIEGLDPSLRLSIGLTLSDKPQSFGYISKMALVGAGGAAPIPEKMLLEVGAEAAHELYVNQVKARDSLQLSNTVRLVMQRVDEDDWKKMQKEVDPSFVYRFYSRASEVESRFPPTPEMMALIKRFATESTSFPDFQRAWQTFVSTESVSAESARKAPLRNKINTFSGEESQVPAYVGNVLSKLSQHKVHYLTDRRAPIGREEAERLLKLKTRRRGPEQLVKIQDTVSALLGVKIDAFEPEEFPQYRERRPERPFAELDVDDFLVEVNGSGIREALRLILDVEFGHPDIVLVEEPEMHLHPALETSVMCVS